MPATVEHPRPAVVVTCPRCTHSWSEELADPEPAPEPEMTREEREAGFLAAIKESDE